ncbi:MAG TPA: toll/interleukin-1 receptor domain-containing protein, partial [Candidatus Nanoarchaeia archaeon]|nr:toll/interleukin-1 receptor domain-containing protein [Candidatus Nanoarchaeia archaeon]
MHNVEYFFSYSRIDSEFVLQLDRELKNAGLNGWLDQSNISPGERWDESIEKALQVCETFIVVLSSSSVKSKNVMDEVSYAISKEKAIVPVLIEKCEIPFRLARFQYIDFTGDYKRAFNDLLNTLRTQSSDQKSITDKKDNNDPKKKKGDLVDRKIPLRYQSDVSARQFLVKKSSK